MKKLLIICIGLLLATGAIAQNEVIEPTITAGALSITGSDTTGEMLWYDHSTGKWQTTYGAYMKWDQSGRQLIFGNTSGITIGESVISRYSSTALQLSKGMYAAGWISTPDYIGAAGRFLLDSLGLYVADKTELIWRLMMRRDTAGHSDVVYNFDYVGSVDMDDALTSPKINDVIIIDGEKYPKTGTGINQAIRDLPYYGGEIYLPPGYYMVDTTILINKTVYLHGAGVSYPSTDPGWYMASNRTTLMAVQNLGMEMIIIQGADSLELSSRNFFTKIEDLGIYGQEHLQTTPHTAIVIRDNPTSGVYGRVSDVIFSDIIVYKVYGIMIDIQTCHLQKFHNCWLEGARGEIFKIDRPANYDNIMALDIDNCTIAVGGDDSLTSNIYIADTSGMLDIIITNCDISQATKHGIELNNVQYISILNNIIRGNSVGSHSIYDAINIDSCQNILISNNHFKNIIGVTSIVQDDAVEATGNSDRIQVMSNNIWDSLEVVLVGNGSLAAGNLSDTSDTRGVFHVKTYGTQSNVALFESTGSDSYINNEAPLGNGAALIHKINNVSKFALYTLTDATHFLTYPSGTNYSMSILSNGNVGIGKSNPGTNQLFVNGNGGSDNIATFGNDIVGVDSSIIILPTGEMGIGVSPSYKLDVNGSSNFRNDVNITNAKTIQWNGGDAAITNASGYNILFKTYNAGDGLAERVRITTDGMTGINKTPSAYLDVYGRKSASDIAYFTNDGDGVKDSTANFNAAGDLIFPVGGNITLSDPGTSANSGTITLTADNSGTTQAGTIQVIYGADPYLRLSAPNDAGAATAILDLKDQRIVIGAGTAGVDYNINWNGETNQGDLTYMEDEDQFIFDAPIYTTNIDTINTPTFTTDIASGVGSRVLVIPAGMWVEAIKIIDVGTTAGLTDIQAQQETSGINLITGKACATTATMLFKTIADHNVYATAKNLTFTATGNSASGMSIIVYLRK